MGQTFANTLGDIFWTTSVTQGLPFSEPSGVITILLGFYPFSVTEVQEDVYSAPGQLKQHPL